ncbi:MAG: FGGY-family carbohydrate kinase, partial [Oscillospiraceae bacterium]
EGIPVAAGAGDTAAGTFGSGMFESNLTMDIAGTASVMCCSANSYSPDTTFSTLNLMRSPVDGIWLPLAYINGGGMCIKWLRDNFTGTPHIDYNSLEHEAALVPAGSEGVLFCPHFSGRVLPANAKMKGCFLGLDFKHTRAHLFRAVMEAIAFEYRYYLSVMKQCYPDAEFESMLCTGGGANSDLFNQIKADILGLTLTTFETADTALLGSAVIAAVGAGVYESYKAPIQKSLHAKAVFRSNSATVSTYEKSYNDYQQMLISTSEFYNADAKINGGIKI